MAPFRGLPHTTGSAGGLDSATAYVSLGMVYSSQGHDEEAIRAFKQATKLDPEMGGLKMLSGNAYMEAGCYDQAIECFQDATKTDAAQARAYFNLGRAYLRVGDKELALTQQRKLRDLDVKLADQLLELIEE